MRIESIQVGTPKTLAADWTSAIYKQQVNGPVCLTKLNLEGDKQADLTVHGGLDKAINVYPIEHYQYWNQRARFLLRKRIELPSPYNGSFGENFTVSSMLENEICIGDTFKVGSVIVQVSQPRQPCWKLARKFNQPKLPFWVQNTSKTGWYFRVLEEGHVENMNEFTLVERTNPSWSIQRANELMYSPKKDSSEVDSILKCKELSESWKKTFSGFIN